MPETMTASAFAICLRRLSPYKFFAYNSREQSEAQAVHEPEVRATFRRADAFINGPVSFIFHENENTYNPGAMLTLRDVRTVIVGDPTIAEIRNIHFVSNPDTGGTVRVTTLRVCGKSPKDGETAEDTGKEVIE